MNSPSRIKIESAETGLKQFIQFYFRFINELPLSEYSGFFQNETCLKTTSFNKILYDKVLTAYGSLTSSMSTKDVGDIVYIGSRSR